MNQLRPGPNESQTAGPDTKAGTATPSGSQDAPGAAAKYDAVVGPFTVRDLTVFGSVLLMFVASLLPMFGGRYNLWNLGNLFFLLLGILLPLIVAALFVARRLQPGTIVRVGSLSIDQFASVTAAFSLPLFFLTIADSFNGGVLLGLIGSLGLLAATVLGPHLPFLSADFKGRADVPAHLMARPAAVPTRKPSAPKEPKPAKEGKSSPGFSIPGLRGSAPKQSGEASGVVHSADSRGQASAPASYGATAPYNGQMPYNGQAPHGVGTPVTPGAAAAGAATHAAAQQAQAPQPGQVPQPGPATSGSPATQASPAVPRSGAGQPAQQGTVAQEQAATQHAPQQGAATQHGAQQAASQEARTEQAGAQQGTAAQQATVAQQAGAQQGTAAQPRTGALQGAGSQPEKSESAQEAATTQHAAQAPAAQQAPAQQAPGAQQAQPAATQPEAQQPSGERSWAATMATPIVSQDTRAVTDSIGATVDPASRPEESHDAPHYEAFWFAVGQPRTAFDERTGAPAFVIEPGGWVLALEDRGHEFLVQDTDGKVGVLRELSNIERG
ncbi:hypothetical protein ACIQTZ_15905 [Paenarthrobacter sp. NPDC090520]|uniref:hypothetical protein n=1 Tax=Paenarthrobacter sp. NPDC090520 TaxID=3364382 RepID=UPI00382A830A